MSEADWTTEEAIAHGRKWPSWAWAVGQVGLVLLRHRRAYARGVVTSVGDDGAIEEIEHFSGRFGVGWGVAPDLRDPGTRGHALAQVREAWGRPGLYAGIYGARWRVKIFGYRGPYCGVVWGDTESEALLAARRAAP